MSKLKDQVVVVTGASSGIGRATALAFAEKGATVVGVARRAEPLESVMAHCREMGVDAVAMACDVRDAEALDRVARDTAGRFGRIDVWVNNAATHLFGTIEEVPVDLWHGVVETNVFGTYHGTRAALPWMREQSSGVLINVASVLGKMGSPYQSAYVASKHAIRAVSDCTRQELRDVPGIAVCTVLPGPIDTPLFQHAANFSGRRVKPIKPVIDAHRVAGTIVSCAERPRRECAVGASTTEILGWNRLFPGLVEKIAARQIDRDHFADAPAQPSRGNVLEPVSGGTEISGGWSRTAQQVGDDDPKAASNDGDGAPVAALALAGGAAAAVAAVAVRSRRS
jgi:NAD(P)-dependent dehydrogenase (short-subunit alcohol dehydrogenase family)